MARRLSRVTLTLATLTGLLTYGARPTAGMCSGSVSMAVPEAMPFAAVGTPRTWPGTSPNATPPLAHYVPSTACTWTVEGPATAAYVQLSFLWLHVEYNYDAVSVTVTARDGTELLTHIASGGQPPFLSANVFRANTSTAGLPLQPLPPPILLALPDVAAPASPAAAAGNSSGAVVRVTFQSDQLVNEQGFLLFVEFFTNAALLAGGCHANCSAADSNALLSSDAVCTTLPVRTPSGLISLSNLLSSWRAQNALPVNGADAFDVIAEMRSLFPAFVLDGNVTGVVNVALPPNASAVLPRCVALSLPAANATACAARGGAPQLIWPDSASGAIGTWPLRPENASTIGDIAPGSQCQWVFLAPQDDASPSQYSLLMRLRDFDLLSPTDWLSIAAEDDDGNVLWSLLLIGGDVYMARWQDALMVVPFALPAAAGVQFIRILMQVGYESRSFSQNRGYGFALAYQWDACVDGCGGPTHGVCVAGVCVCAFGYAGDRCQWTACPVDSCTVPDGCNVSADGGNSSRCPCPSDGTLWGPDCTLPVLQAAPPGDAGWLMDPLFDVVAPSGVAVTISAANSTFRSDGSTGGSLRVVPTFTNSTAPWSNLALAPQAWTLTDARALPSLSTPDSLRLVLTSLSPFPALARHVGVAADALLGQISITAVGGLRATAAGSGAAFDASTIGLDPPTFLSTSISLGQLWRESVHVVVLPGWTECVVQYVPPTECGSAAECLTSLVNLTLAAAATVAPTVINTTSPATAALAAYWFVAQSDILTNCDALRCGQVAGPDTGAPPTADTSSFAAALAEVAAGLSPSTTVRSGFCVRSDRCEWYGSAPVGTAAPAPGITCPSGVEGALCERPICPNRLNLYVPSQWPYNTTSAAAAGATLVTAGVLASHAGGQSSPLNIVCRWLLHWWTPPGGWPNGGAATAAAAAAAAAANTTLSIVVRQLQLYEDTLETSDQLTMFAYVASANVTATTNASWPLWTPWSQPYPLEVLPATSGSFPPWPLTVAPVPSTASLFAPPGLLLDTAAAWESLAVEFLSPMRVPGSEAESVAFAGVEVAFALSAMCPMSCSGHGTCLFAGDEATFVPASGYRLTAAEAAQFRCLCDGGWAGPTCATFAPAVQVLSWELTASTASLSTTVATNIIGSWEYRYYAVVVGATLTGNEQVGQLSVPWMQLSTKGATQMFMRQTSSPVPFDLTDLARVRSSGSPYVAISDNEGSLVGALTPADLPSPDDFANTDGVWYFDNNVATIVGLNRSLWLIGIRNLAMYGHDMGNTDGAIVRVQATVECSPLCNAGGQGACDIDTMACVCSDPLCWTGPSCTLPLVSCNELRDAGRCVAGLCTCLNGWSGNYCQTPPPDVGGVSVSSSTSSSTTRMVVGALIGILIGVGVACIFLGCVVLRATNLAALRMMRRRRALRPGFAGLDEIATFELT